jgi:folate-binding protein YgfZ
MPIARLDDRAVIAVTGSEARPFLQGLITNDIEMVAPGRAIYAALLTPQGKVLFDFLIAEGDGALLIDCARSTRDALAKRLSMYRLRAKATIEPRDQLEVLAEWDGDRAKYAITFEDPRLPALGRRAIGAAGEMPAAVLDAAAYRSRRLELGVPESVDFGSDRMFALDADLDELHAIAFDKGCYVGQELTARMKHRGTARKRLLPVESVSGAELPGPDTSVTAAGKDVGDIASTYGAKGFAQIRLDRLEDAGDGPLQAGTTAVRIRRPDWLFS